MMRIVNIVLVVLMLGAATWTYSVKHAAERDIAGFLRLALPFDLPLAPELLDFRGPKIVGGDFNAFPGSDSVSALALAAGVSALGPRVVGRAVEVLVEADGRGHTPHFAPLALDRPAAPGDLVRAHVTGHDGTSLRGALI